jgi:hypothetical protein
LKITLANRTRTPNWCKKGALRHTYKVQAIRRQKAVSQCDVNLPLPLAAVIDIQPGEIVEWKVDTRYKLFLIRQ